MQHSADKSKLLPFFLSAMSLNGPTTPEISIVTPTRQLVLMGSRILKLFTYIRIPDTMKFCLKESFCELGEDL